MNRTGACKTGSVATSDQPVMEWRVHLLREDPKKLLVVVPVVLASLFASYVFFGSPIFAVVVVFLFASSLCEYLFPVYYRLTREGACMRTLTGRNFVPWTRVKRYYLDECGIKLSTLPSAGRLEAYRGVYLRFGGNRDEVAGAVRRLRDEVCQDA
ncbi:MAG TPA: hypothetical protein DCL60_08935 [Armatimonadetes bacterium]|jgi:hypothetical protein|nr:hypothetical protein [Armatimonadota bacterium]